jgi:hypothetical protein
LLCAKSGSIPRISHVLGYKNSDVLGERLNPWRFFNPGAQSRNCSALKPPRDIPPSQPTSNEACEQSSNLNCSQRSCGQSLDEAGILDLALAARPYPIYVDHPQVPFAFEMMESEGWSEKVKVFAQSWLEVSLEYLEF